MSDADPSDTPSDDTAADATPVDTGRLPMVDRDSWGALDDTDADCRYRLVVVRSRRD